MKRSFFAILTAKIYDELEKKMMTVLKYYHDNPEVYKSICSG